MFKDPGQYWREFRTGNFGRVRFIGLMIRALYGGRDTGSACSRRCPSMAPSRRPRVRAAGPAVGRARSRCGPPDEIEATLDDPASTAASPSIARCFRYCGRTFRVKDRVSRLIDETTGRMLRDPQGLPDPRGGPSVPANAAPGAGSAPARSTRSGARPGWSGPRTSGGVRRETARATNSVEAGRMRLEIRTTSWARKRRRARRQRCSCGRSRPALRARARRGRARGCAAEVFRLLAVYRVEPPAEGGPVDAHLIDLGVRFASSSSTWTIGPGQCELGAQEPVRALVRRPAGSPSTGHGGRCRTPGRTWRRRRERTRACARTARPGRASSETRPRSARSLGCPRRCGA